MLTPCVNVCECQMFTLVWSQRCQCADFWPWLSVTRPYLAYINIWLDCDGLIPHLETDIFYAHLWSSNVFTPCMHICAVTCVYTLFTHLRASNWFIPYVCTFVTLNVFTPVVWTFVSLSVFTHSVYIFVSLNVFMPYGYIYDENESGVYKATY